MKIIEQRIIIAKDIVEKERKRLLNMPNEKDFKLWIKNREYPLKYMKSRFGETLKEKDGFTNPDGSRFNEADCNVCGKGSEPNEKILRYDFSFCDEYSCGINICAKCLKDGLGKLK